MNMSMAILFAITANRTPVKNSRKYAAMIKITKAGALFMVHATPPHVKEEWTTAEPLTARLLAERLRLRGAHQTDIGDAFYEVDPSWASN
jgi:hypothetical protein